MIKALNTEAWCFITMFNNINTLSALIDPLATSRRKKNKFNKRTNN